MSGQVTTKQFHAELVKTTKELGRIRLETSEMELRIVDRINVGITAQQEYQQKADAKFATDKARLDSLDDEVKNLKIWDRALGILSIIGTTFGIGIKQ